MNTKNKPIQWLLTAILATSSCLLMAQPVVLNPLTTAENLYGGTSMNNNTGNDICNVTSPPGAMVNVMVYENGTNVYLTHQYTTSAATGTTTLLGSALPAGTTFSDPDVVSVVSSSPGIGNFKERIIVVYIADTPGPSQPTIYMEMFDWFGSLFMPAGGPFDLSIGAGAFQCNTPNVDADYLGYYAITWEEDTRVYMTSANAFATWGSAPTTTIDYSVSCGATPTQKEPDVCIIPYNGTNSIINVAFRSNNTLHLQRIRTNQIPTMPGVFPFPSANCSSPMFYTQNFAPGAIEDIRIACPPIATTTRHVLDLTMAFTYQDVSGNTNIVTGTHSFINYPPMGTISFNMMNVAGSSSFPASGPDYANRKPAVAYKIDPEEFVVAWEFTDLHTGGNNAYAPANNNNNLVAVRCTDANIPINLDMSSVDNIFNATNTADAVSISKGDIPYMQYGFVKDFNAIRYNSTFWGLNLKKENPGKIWFVDYSQSVTGVSDFTTVDSDIKMYPNPVAYNGGDIHLDLNNTTVSEISIMTIDGKQVYHVDIENQSTVTIPNQFPKGAYFVVIKSAETQETKKLMIQ